MASQFDVHLLAYCLMPNHYHLAIRTPRANLSRAVGWLQTIYTMRHNRRHGRVGHLFQGRFKAILVEQDAYAISLMRYIHLNPVRIRALRSADVRQKMRVVNAFKWSSHRMHAGMATPLPGLRFDWLRYYGARQAEARQAYGEDLRQTLQNGEEIKSPWEDLRGGLVLGGAAFWEKVRGLVKGKEGREEIRWSEEQRWGEQREAWRERMAEETDARWKIWLRVRALGERKADIARELGFCDGGSVLQIMKRLEARARKDEAYATKLNGYLKDLSSVKR